MADVILMCGATGMLISADVSKSLIRKKIGKYLNLKKCSWFIYEDTQSHKKTTQAALVCVKVGSVFSRCSVQIVTIWAFYQANHVHHTSVVVCTFISPSKQIQIQTHVHTNAVTTTMKMLEKILKSHTVEQRAFILDLLQFAYQLSTGVDDAKALLKQRVSHQKTIL